MPAGLIRALRALGSFRTLGPLRTIELRVPLRPIGAILAAVGTTVFLPYVVGAAVLLPVGAPVFLAIRTPVFLAVGLAVGAAVFLANVGLRECGGGAPQHQRGHGG